MNPHVVHPTITKSLEREKEKHWLGFKREIKLFKNLHHFAWILDEQIPFLNLLIREFPSFYLFLRYFFGGSYINMSLSINNSKQ